MSPTTTRAGRRDPAVSLRRGPYQQAYLVAANTSGNDTVQAAEKLYLQIATLLERENQAIVHERIFGSLDAEPAVMAARRRALQKKGLPLKGPVTCIEGRPPWGQGLAGVIIRCVDWSTRPQLAEESGQPRGFEWQAGGFRFVALQDFQDREGALRGEEGPRQIRRLIDRAHQLLQRKGASYRHVVRTWFYLSDILKWYGSFNEARSAKYRELHLLPPRTTSGLVLPASTGIEGKSIHGSAGVLDLLALDGPRRAASVVRRLSNVGQKEAFDYGSAFSRGVLIAGDELSIIEVSGTAAIDERGRSRHEGCFDAQVEETLGKVASLLEPEGAQLEHIAASTVFVKDGKDAPRFWEIARAHGLEQLPAVPVVADVCRRELLFEMDASVVYPSRDQGAGEA